MYDDRLPFSDSPDNSYGPPLPISSYRPPYAETVYSHDREPVRSQYYYHPTKREAPPPSTSRRARAESRYSEPTSPRTRRLQDFPIPGVQYGTGPIPEEFDPFHPPNYSIDTKKVPGLDPETLEKVLTKAVKQGIEELRRGEAPREDVHRRQHHHAESASQPPGAWPLSPSADATQPYQQTGLTTKSSRRDFDHHDATWGRSQGSWDQLPSRARAGTKVTWNEEPAWEAGSNASEWNSREETPSDSWDTDQTWTPRKLKGQQENDRRGRSNSERTSIIVESRAASPITVRIRDRSRRRNESARELRSKSTPRRYGRQEMHMSSTGSNEGWTHIDATSDSMASWELSDDTVEPAHSRSQVQTPRSKSRRHSRHTYSTPSGHGRKLYQHTHQALQGQPLILQAAPAPSIMTHVTPTVMNAPAFIYPTEKYPREASLNTVPAPSALPLPEWTRAFPTQERRFSTATDRIWPTPFAPTLQEVSSTIGQDHENRSTSSSSWGSVKKSKGNKSSWDDNVKKKSERRSPKAGKWGKNYYDEKSKNDCENVNSSQKNTWGVRTKKTGEKTNRWKIADDTWKIDPIPAEQKENPGPSNAWDTTKTDWNTTEAGNDQSITKGVKASWNNTEDMWNPNDTGNTMATKDGSTTKIVETSWGNAEDAWNAQAAPSTNNGNAVQFKTETLWEPATVETQPIKARSVTSKRHSNKTLSKYRQLRNASSDVVPKSHWQFPPPPSEKRLSSVHEDHRGFIAPKEPLYKISERVANKRGVEHQVRAGRGSLYGHEVGRPEYLDSLDKPVSQLICRLHNSFYQNRLINNTVRSVPLQIPQPAHSTLPLRQPDPLPRAPTHNTHTILLHRQSKKQTHTAPARPARRQDAQATDQAGTQEKRQQRQPREEGAQATQRGPEDGGRGDAVDEELGQAAESGAEREGEE